MKKRIINTTLAASLAFQNFALADSRVDGIGNSAIETAQAELSLLRGNLTHIDFELRNIENSIVNHKNDGSIAAGIGIISGVTSVVGSAFGVYGLGSKDGIYLLGGLGIQILASLVSIESYGANITLVNEVELKSKLNSEIENAKTKLYSLRGDGNDKFLNVTIERAARKIEELQSAFNFQNARQKEIIQRRITSVVGQSISEVLAIIYLSSKKLQPSKSLVSVILLSSAASQIAAMYYSTKDLDQAELLREIRLTRDAISVAEMALK